MKASATAKKTKAGRKPQPESPEPLLVRLVAIDDIDPSPLNRSARNIDELVASVRKVASIMTEIAAASHEQSSGIDQINKAIT